MKQYNLLVNAGSMVINHWVNTDVNLLEMYKSALVSVAIHITWEKGVIDVKSVVGIIDNTIEGRNK